MKDRKHNPCYQCPNRQMGCHTTCESYQAWKTLNDKERDDRYEAKKKAEAVRTVSIKKWKRYNGFY